MPSRIINLQTMKVIAFYKPYGFFRHTVYKSDEMSELRKTRN